MELKNTESNRLIAISWMDDHKTPDRREKPDAVFSKSRRRFAGVVFLFLALAMTISWLSSTHVREISSLGGDCDTPHAGYQCDTSISHQWGQYSPFFKVTGSLSPEIPTGCEVTFAQLLSRHGARDPTLNKTILYNETISKIQSSVDEFKGDFAFLADYTYTLGADQLTLLGEQELVNSGIEFFNRYESLAKKHSPFVRAASQERVAESAQKFIKGYLERKRSSTGATPAPDPYPVLVIREGVGSNNTLGHQLCTAFAENPAYNNLGHSAQGIYASTFLPPIIDRLNANLRPLSLNVTDAISIMDLCPFNTVASSTGAISPFCALFSRAEWGHYNHYQSLGKFYGCGAGNPLGPTQGVGYVNELIARLTASPVDDHTTTNQTLDSNPDTFPVGPQYPLFADFSHDNTMTSIYAALGLYRSFPPPAQKAIRNGRETDDYSAATSVPFGARMYVEKLQCQDEDEEVVRIIINGKVVPVEACKGHGSREGQCPLSRFLETLAFAKSGGRWDECFQ